MRTIRLLLAEGRRAIRRGSTGQEKMQGTKEKRNSVEEVRKPAMARIGPRVFKTVVTRPWKSP